MTVEEVAAGLDLTLLSPGADKQAPVTGGYCSDLLSDVMANARPGDVWITAQTHMNVVAVASLAQVALVVVSGGRKLGEDVLTRARSEGVAVASTVRTTFEVAGVLYSLGVRPRAGSPAAGPA